MTDSESVVSEEKWERLCVQPRDVARQGRRHLLRRASTLRAYRTYLRSVLHAPDCPWRLAREWVDEHYDGPTEVRAIPPREQRATLSAVGIWHLGDTVTFWADGQSYDWVVDRIDEDGTLACIRA